MFVFSKDFHPSDRLHRSNAGHGSATTAATKKTAAAFCALQTMTVVSSSRPKAVQEYHTAPDATVQAGMKNMAAKIPNTPSKPPGPLRMPLKPMMTPTKPATAPAVKAAAAAVAAKRRRSGRGEAEEGK